MLAARTQPAERAAVASVDLGRWVRETLNSWPAVGMAAGIVGREGLRSFHTEGLANIAERMPITKDTVFRIASITKTFTAIAVMQLWEQGLIDLDAPAHAYLRAYRLESAKASFQPATVRHLLTHTAGIRELLHLSGITRMRDLGETVKVGQHVPSLAEYYKGRLRVSAEPGTRFMYTDHGFATLGQIVEDVTGQPLAKYMRDHIFEPLGMEHTDLQRSDRVSSPAATPYELGRSGAVAVDDYDLITVGGGAAYSTSRDMARYVAALLDGGANEHGSALKPSTLAVMFGPQYQPDPRIPGMGLAFFRGDVGGHLAIHHDGILPGFDSQMFLLPEDGIAVVALANGAKRGFFWLTPYVKRLLRESLGIPEQGIRSDVPQRPELWSQLCGSYRFDADWSDASRLFVGPTAQVQVSNGRLVLRSHLSPLRALHRGFVLHPDDPDDPYLFRIEIPSFGLGSGRVVFSARSNGTVAGFHLDFAPMSFRKRIGR